MTHTGRDIDPGPEISPDTRVRCRKAGPDRHPAGMRGWTTDRCANVVFTLVKRPVEHYALGQPVPRRRWEFVSVRPIRAVANEIEGEMCKQHYARLVKVPGQGWRIVFCSMPGQGMKLWSVGTFFIERKATRIIPTARVTGIQPGRAGFAAGHPTPLWTEAHVHSFRRVCGAEEE